MTVSVRAEKEKEEDDDTHADCARHCRRGDSGRRSLSQPSDTAAHPSDAHLRFNRRSSAAMRNIYSNIPDHGPTEEVMELLSRPGLRIERIVSNGHATPAGQWYDQPHAEWVMVVCGAARLRFEDQMKELEMRAGDMVDIPAHRRHRVEWTDPAVSTVWLAVHYDPAAASEEVL
jgi:cupin 2 domain-containing protein